MTFNTISHMAFTAKNCVPHFQSMMLEMACQPWHDTGPDEFAGTFGEIESFINDPVLKKLFHYSLWGQLLIDPAPPVWAEDFLVQHTLPDPILGMDYKLLMQGDWIRIPVLTAGNDTARVAWFIAGLVPRKNQGLFIPEWAKQIMDEKFRESAVTAEQMARHCSPDPTDRRFVLYPMAPDNGWLQFQDGSAALAFGLGFKSLAHKQPLSRELIATGCLDHSEKVMPVGHIDLKIQAARKNENGFKCIILPADGSPGPGHDAGDLVPVNDFAETWTMASLYSGRQDNLLFIFSRALQNPAAFISRMDSMPGEWIDRETTLVQKLLTQVFGDSVLFDQFTRKFLVMVSDFQLNRASALVRQAPENLPESSPMACLRWIAANLSLANHQGDVQTAEKWEVRGMALTDRVMELDMNLVTDFFNHALVAAHNRYKFYIELLPTLARLIEFLEKRHSMQQEFGCRVDLSLGRLYGTLVQNAAFYGSGFIQKTELLSGKARQALGENTSPEFKPEWMRQYCYLALARLDAGDMDGALSCLKIYLEVQELETVPEQLSNLTQWQISLLCRFLAKSAPEDFNALYSALVTHLPNVWQQDHPWQLACFNLARAAVLQKDQEMAKRLFEKSLDICLKSSLGPTIEVMALKPLAFMEDLIPGHVFEPRLLECETQIRQASLQLNKEHFSFLHDRSFHQGLAYVRKNHGRIFSFSYA